jgi:hypothetical protein
VSNNIHNIGVLDKAEIVQEYQDRVDGKLKDMKRTEPLKFRLSSYALPPKDKKSFFDLES